jgi:hypothetical protein
MVFLRGTYAWCSYHNVILSAPRAATVDAGPAAKPTGRLPHNPSMADSPAGEGLTA